MTNSTTNYSGAAVLDYPAVVAVQPTNNEIQNGDVLWVQPSKAGKLGWWFTAMDVATNAAAQGRDADQALTRARDFGHAVYWLIGKPVAVSKAPTEEKDKALYFNEGDTVIYQGVPLKIVAQANDNWGFEEL